MHGVAFRQLSESSSISPIDYMHYSKLGGATGQYRRDAILSNASQDSLPYSTYNLLHSIEFFHLLLLIGKNQSVSCLKLIIARRVHKAAKILIENSRIPIVQHL